MAPKIVLEDLGRAVAVPSGANLREALLDADVTLYPMAAPSLCFTPALLNCRGKGVCGTCRVKVTAGDDNLTPRTAAEMKKLRKRPDLRLACQIAVRGDCSVLTLP